MTKLYNFDYMLNREDLKYCNEKLDKIFIDLNKAMDLINEIGPILNKSQKIFYIMQKKDTTGNLRRKFSSFGEIIENTQLGFSEFYKYFKDFYDYVAEEKKDIDRQISSKSMTNGDIHNLADLFDFRLDELDCECEACCNDVANFKGKILRIREEVLEMHKEYRRGGDYSKIENPFQRGDLQIVK